MKKIEKFYNSKLGQSIAELLRWVLFGAIGLIVDGLIIIFTEQPTSNLSFFILFGLRFVDAILHKSGLAEKGISRF